MMMLMWLIHAKQLNDHDDCNAKNMCPEGIKKDRWRYRLGIETLRVASFLDLSAETRPWQIAENRIAVHAAGQRLDAGRNVDAVAQIAGGVLLVLDICGEKTMLANVYFFEDPSMRVYCQLCAIDNN